VLTNEIDSNLYIVHLNRVIYNKRPENPKFTAFTRPNGHNEFLEFVQSLPVKDQQKLLITLEKIEEHGLPVASRMEWVKPSNKDIYEIRSKVESDIQRALYFHVVGNEFVITHGFTKKT
jgi:phage-related protein